MKPKETLEDVCLSCQMAAGQCGPTYLKWWPIMPVPDLHCVLLSLASLCVSRQVTYKMGWPLIGTRDQVPWLICGPWCCRIFAYDWYIRYLEWTAQWVWRLERQEYHLFHPAGCNWTNHLKVVEVAVRMIQNLFVALISLGESKSGFVSKSETLKLGPAFKRFHDFDVRCQGSFELF